MAVKAYYGGPGWPQGGSAAAGGRGGWVAPGTIGNPDGAFSGGGAYAKGGNNPNGPNQGGGGGGGGGSFGMQADSISSSCPSTWQALPTLPGGANPWGGIPCGCFNDFTSPFGPLTTTLTPQVPSINGNPLLVFALTTGPNRVCVCLSGVLPQNTLNTIAVDGIWGESYIAANADIFDNSTWASFGNGITIWAFNTNIDPFNPFLFGIPFTVTWT